MPTRAKSICNQPGCSALTDARYCAKHDRGTEQEQRRAYDMERNKGPLRQLYNGSLWRRTSKYVIACNPVCQDCGRESSAVTDHVVRAATWIAQGHDFYDLDNLQALCKACHDKKTAVECGFAGGHQ